MTDIVVRDLVMVSTTTTGTGTYTLSTSAELGYLTPANAGVPNGSLVSYRVFDPATGESERALGVLSTGGTPTLTRAVVRMNHLGTNAPVNWGVGTRLVILTLQSEDVVLRANDGHLTGPGQLLIQCGTAGYSGNAYTVAPSGAPTAYRTGETVQVVIADANTAAAPTLNRNSLGAKPLVNRHGVPLQAGWAKPGILLATYDGTNYVAHGIESDICGYTLIASSIGSIVFNLPAGYRLFDVEGQSLFPQTSSGLQIGLQVSLDGGSNFIATGYTNLTRITNASGVDASTIHATTNIAMVIYDPAGYDVVGFHPGTFRSRVDIAANSPQIISSAAYTNRNGGGTAFHCSMDVKTNLAGQVSPINAVRVLMSGGSFQLGGRVFVRAIA